MIRKDFIESMSQTEQKDVVAVLSNPLIWAEATFPARIGVKSFPNADGKIQKQRELISGWRTRPWQLDVIESPGLRKVVRVSRRGGKTAMAIVKCLHKAFVEGRGVIIVAPMEKQVGEIYREMHKKFMDTRPDIFTREGENPTVIQDTRSPFVIQFSNGGFINFITAGTKSGGRADAVRGQGSNVGLIYVDEMDYLSDADMNSIFAILGQDESMEMICTSTPTGRRGFFYRLCTKPPRNWKAFHKTCWDAIPNWNEERDREARELLGQAGYEREMLAEFGQEAEGVFNKATLDEAADRGKGEEYPYPLDSVRMVPTHYPFYGYAQKLDADPRVRRIVGVDWDKYGAGTQILVIEARLTERSLYGDDSDATLEEPFSYIKVVHRREITRGEFTLSEAVKQLVQINMTFSPDFYYLDAGYGEHQIETLQRLGMECKDPMDAAYGIHKKIRRINFSSGVNAIDPISKQPEKRPIKPEMVGRLRNKFDVGEMILSPFDEVLLKQLENYRVEKITASGQPKYVSVNEHAVDALMLAVWGLYTEYGDKFDSSALIGFVDKPIGRRFEERLEALKNTANHLLSRPDYIKDDVLQDNIKEDVEMAKSGYIRAEKFADEKYDAVYKSVNTHQSSGFFKRGGHGPLNRRSF